MSVPLTSCSKVFFFKTNCEKVKHFFYFFEGSKGVCIERDSFSSYSCSALTEVSNPLNLLEFFKIRACAVCSKKNNIHGASSTVQINPTKYLVHPTLFRHMFELTPSVLFVRTVKNLTLLPYFSDSDVVFNLRIMYHKNIIYI